MLRSEGGIVNLWRDFVRGKNAPTLSRSIPELHPRAVEEILCYPLGPLGCLHNLRRQGGC